jgi:hypothetical protein
MAVKTKSAPKRVARPKVAAPKVLPEARVKAKARNVESRSRAVAESGAKPTAPRIEIYRLKNRATGETRILVDARGDGSVAAKPWLVVRESDGATVGFETRKALGKGYSAADLFAPAKKARPKRVAKK